MSERVDKELVAWLRWKYGQADPVEGSVTFRQAGYDDNVLVVEWLQAEPAVHQHAPGKLYLTPGPQSMDLDDLDTLARELLEAEWKLDTAAPPAS